MPFKSEAQRRYLWQHEPQIAKRWAHKYDSKALRQKAIRKMKATKSNGLSSTK